MIASDSLATGLSNFSAVPHRTPKPVFVIPQFSNYYFTSCNIGYNKLSQFIKQFDYKIYRQYLMEWRKEQKSQLVDTVV